jgi:hypothetical protein
MQKNFYARACDVYGEDLGIRVECGHTAGVRLIRSFWIAKEFWVLQFPNKDMKSNARA